MYVNCVIILVSEKKKIVVASFVPSCCVSPVQSLSWAGYHIIAYCVLGRPNVFCVCSLDTSACNYDYFEYGLIGGNKTCRISLYISSLKYMALLLLLYRSADKSLARPGRKQATATEDFDLHISYL
jgi:hypothetical protein